MSLPVHISELEIVRGRRLVEEPGGEVRVEVAAGDGQGLGPDGGGDDQGAEEALLEGRHGLARPYCFTAAAYETCSSDAPFGQSGRLALQVLTRTV